MTTIIPRPAATIKIDIDKENDIIPLTVGMYRLFSSAGSLGQDAMTLYMHLIFTARIQETRQVYANLRYLCNGLKWGIERMKRAKAWLSEHGIIEYIQYRGADGRMSEVYIKLCFLMSSETLIAKMSGVPRPEATDKTVDGPEAEAGDFQMELNGLFEDEESAGDKDIVSGAVTEEMPNTASPGGDKTEKVITGGMDTAPPVNRATGAENQMLKVRNQMLKARKESTRPPESIYQKQKPQSRAENDSCRIAVSWYRRLAKETSVAVKPQRSDFRSAEALYDALSGDLSRLEEAIDIYFSRWREFWFCVKKSTCKLPNDKKQPDYSFAVFCTRYAEILVTGGYVLNPSPEVRSRPVCPVCGHLAYGGVCTVCGYTAGDDPDTYKAEVTNEPWFFRRLKMFSGAK